LLASLIISGPVLAQGDPRSNVNVVGMTPDPADFPDTSYRQQNEPACAVRPGDSACIICAYNDYRAVDDLGDAWEGVSQSCDAGDSWLSRLAPGHPGDLDAEVLPAAFAADPRLVAIPGMAIFNFIAGYRDTNEGVLAIQHWLEVNKEDADHYEPGRVTHFADTGTSGRFLDKPDMVAVLDSGTSTIAIQTEMENPAVGDNGTGFITRDYPAGTLYVAYAVFTGSQSVKVLVKTSRDWGLTWKNQALKLSEDQNQVSGISLTAIGDQVLAVWRRKGDGNDLDSIMYSWIRNGGKKATKGEVLADLCAFDQPTLTGSEDVPGAPLVAFRTNDFPWTANDGKNFYAFYSDRGRAADGTCDAFGRPRINVHHTNIDTTALDFSTARLLESETDIDNSDSFQFMPTAFGANGKVQVAWYDTRRETFGGAATPWPFVVDYNVAGSLFVQRTVDVFSTSVSLSSNGALQVTPSVRVSQFSIRVGEDSLGDEQAYETEASFANKKLFAQGNAPFLGDYIAIAAREFRRNSADTAWESNASAVPGNHEDFFAAWTDNRDVRGQIGDLLQPLPYGVAALDKVDTAADPLIETGKQMLAHDQSPLQPGPPRDTTKTAEGVDGSDPFPGQCGPDTPRTRDANIYGSLIKDDFRLYATTPNKPLSGLKRAFAISLSNSAGSDKTYRLSIVDQAGILCDASCAASFRQQRTEVIDDPVVVTAFSTAARTVFIDPAATAVNVQVQEVLSTPGSLGPVIASIRLGNTDSLLNPNNCPAGDLSCATSANETHQLTLESLFSANLLNPTLVDRAVAGGCCSGEENPTIGSVIEWATINLDPNIDGDAALLNEALAAANLLNANLLNANLLNANLLNANLLNASPTDLSVLDPELVAACSAVPQTIGDVIVCASDLVNANLLNANLLNAALLNVNLLSANLLNANLLNANLLNANLLNAALLNANLLNAALLNLSVEAANLLNANLLNAALLNADLLNANLLNPTLVALAVEGGCCTGTAEPMTVDIISYALENPDTINAALLNASLLNAALLNANLLNANLLNADLLNANLLNANLLNADLLNANLLNADLLNANLLNANLLNADLLNADLLNANLLNTSLLAAAATAPDELDNTVTYDDYTYPVTNNGNVNTAINADITINGEVIGTKLMAWTVNATPMTVGCEDGIEIDTRIQSIVPNPDSDFEEATIGSPFEGEVSTIAGPGETVFFTLRVIGTPRQLMGVKVSGFTASSQAADCRADGTTNGFCENSLRSDNEKIVFKDTTSPLITLLGPNPLLLDQGIDSYVEFGATASDNLDGDISASIEIVGANFVDENTKGNYPVDYNVTDSSGNMADTATRIVSVLDMTAPVITLNGTGGPIVTLEAGVDTYVEDGATVADAGNPATAAVIGGDTVDTTTVGTYIVTYTANDGVNTPVVASRTVNVEDTTPPVITLGGTGGPVVTLEAGVDTYVEDGATVADAGNPALIAAAVGGDFVDTNTVGTYIVTYTADDLQNLPVTITRTVNVVDTTAPVITVNDGGNPIVFIANEPRGAFVDLSSPVPYVTATDLGQAITVTCTTTTTAGTFIVLPDWLPPGDYVVNCTATDGTSVAIPVTITIDIIDAEAPVLTVPVTAVTAVADPITGTAVVDFSSLVSAIDNVDSSVAIVCSPPSSSVFPTGSTTVSCSASDDGPNASGVANIDTKTFIVTVTDDTPPIITAPDVELRRDYFDLEDPDWARIAVAEYTSGVVANDAVNGAITLISCDRDDAPPGPLLATDFEFSDASYGITCSAADSAGNIGTGSFALTVRYLYDINLIPPKGRARAGSTVPLDWQYLDQGVLVNSSAVDVRVSWAKMTGSSCTVPDLGAPGADGSSGLGDDSGFSDFRYSASSDKWQFSWQTPDITGYFKVSVSPPGANVRTAWECINLR